MVQTKIEVWQTQVSLKGYMMPRQPEPSWEDGMRSVRHGEFDSLRKLIDTVFFPGLIEVQPHAFHPDNAANLRVVVENGQVVSHIGTIRRYVSIFGCTLRVASLGGVATYASHRGKGYATALLQDTVRACREDGVDYMMVSGYRTMYHRYGCRYVGRDWMFAVDDERAGDFDDAAVSVEPATQADVAAVAGIYRREPVRWLRPPSDIAYGIEGRVSNRPARTLLVKRGKSLQAFAVVQTAVEKDEGRVRVLDYGGERAALVGALGKFVRAQKLKRLSLQVMGYDAVLRELLEARDLAGDQVNVPGTTMVIRFAALMEKMRPYFAERAGEKAANGLVFKEVEDEFRVYFGGDCVVADSRGAAAQLIFGALNRAEDAMLQAGGKAGEALRECLPIPGLCYGVNYV